MLCSVREPLPSCPAAERLRGFCRAQSRQGKQVRPAWTSPGRAVRCVAWVGGAADATLIRRCKALRRRSTPPCQCLILLEAAAGRQSAGWRSSMERVFGWPRLDASARGGPRHGCHDLEAVARAEPHDMEVGVEVVAVGVARSERSPVVLEVDIKIFGAQRPVV